MPHLIVGHILRSQHRQHPRQSRRPAVINRKHPGPGILRADCGGIYHSLHLHIIRVFPIPQHLFPHIQAEGPASHAVLLPLLQILLNPGIPPQNRRGQGNALNNLLIARAPAYISPDGGLNLLLRGIRILVNQRLSRHHHSRRAEAALNRSLGAEGVDKGLLLPAA